DENNCPFIVYSTTTDNFASDLLLTTGSEDHIRQLLQIQNPIPSGNSEQVIFQSLGLSYIEPELREGLNEIDLAKNNQLPSLITLKEHYTIILRILMVCIPWRKWPDIVRKIYTWNI